MFHEIPAIEQAHKKYRQFWSPFFRYRSEALFDPTFMGVAKRIHNDGVSDLTRSHLKTLLLYRA